MGAVFVAVGRAGQGPGGARPLWRRRRRPWRGRLGCPM